MHAYNGRPVLRIDAMDLVAGRITAVVGPNGSGKSTLLRILGFIERPVEGRFQLDGAAVATNVERQVARQAVTLIEQRPLLFRGTVLRNLTYALRLHDVAASAAQTRSLEALARLGATELASRSARELSEGQTQTVALARAIALRPRVLLLDEPASAADRASLLHLTTVLREERDRGLAVCFATHVLDDAYRLSDNILSLSAGSATAITPENLFRTFAPVADGPKVVNAGPLKLQIVTNRTGSVTIAIPPNDIVVSREPLHSSARNQFAGRVVRAAEDGLGTITLTVDVGVDLIARITRAAFEELGITVGSPVVLSIKAMAVRVI